MNPRTTQYSNSSTTSRNRARIDIGFEASMSLHLSSACFPTFSRSKFAPARAVEGGVDVKAAEVEKKSLGGSELKVSKLGIGAWSWGDTSYWNSFDWDDRKMKDAKAAFDASLDCGITFIDTAEVYGSKMALGAINSETLLGRFIKERKEREPDMEVTVATKYAALPWRLGRRSVISVLKGSLSRLGMSSVDLYQLHWPGIWGNEGYIDGLADAVEQGLVKAVGVSNYNEKRLRDAYNQLKKRGIPLASNQVNYSLIYRLPEDNGVKAACDELGITLIAYSPIAQDTMPPRREIQRDIPEDIGSGAPPPPPQDTVARMLEGLTQLLERAQTVPAPRPHMDIYERFRRLNPTEFFGTTDPFVAEGWIGSLETHFCFLNMNDADRVRCTVYLFRDDAALWWSGARKGVDLNTCTWEQFKRIFYAKYFSSEVRSRVKREFLSLRQGDQSVAEYIRKFDRGCQFVPLIANDPEEKLRHFVDGLKPMLRKDVLLVEPVDYAAATNRALKAEHANREIELDLQRKRQQGQSFQQSNKRQNSGPSRPQGQQKSQGPPRQQNQQRPPQTAEQNSGDRPLCRECQKPHFGKCLQGKFRCYYCKDEGHVASVCPKRSQAATARAYVMHAEEAEPDTTLITDSTVDDVDGTGVLGD